MTCSSAYKAAFRILLGGAKKGIGKKGLLRSRDDVFLVENRLAAIC